MEAIDRETPVTIGRVFADKYRVDGLLGNGGMGVVFAATHLQLETRVAIKLLRADVSRTDTAAARLLREARATARINSENVARILDIGTVDWSGLYVVMEYLDGDDLAAVMQKQPRWAPDQAVRCLLQACEGVRAAHALGIVHRDLKPSNLFVTRNSSGAPRIKVLDFGLSKLIDPETGSPIVTRGGGQLTLPDSMLGSPAYTSPEQLTDPRAVDGRTDIWSLGVILFELLAGQRPFEAKTLPELSKLILNGRAASLRERRPDLPAGLEAVVQRCLQRAPTDRYPDVGALMKDLAPFARPTDAEPPSHPPPAPAPTKGWRRWTAVGAGLVLTLGVLAVVVGRFGRAPPGAPAVQRTPPAQQRESAAALPPPTPPSAVQTCRACLGERCARKFNVCRANGRCGRVLAAYNACVKRAADPKKAGCQEKLGGDGHHLAQQLTSCVFARGVGSTAVSGACASACTGSVLGLP